MKAFIAFLLAVGLVILLMYLCSLLPAPAASSSSTIHQTIDNHVTLIVVNNIPFDWSGVALLILSVAVLIYVIWYVIWIVVQALMELRRRH